MTIKTVHLAPGLPVMLRRGFEPLTTAEGAPLADRNGQPYYVAEAVVPGRVAGRYGIDADRPDTVRIRTAGANPGYPDAGTVVRLAGRVTATVWYTPRARGAEARSNLTITAEHLEPTTGTTPAVRGGLPAVFPADVPVILLGQADDGTADLMLAAVGTYTVDGIAEVRCATPVPTELVGAQVAPVGLRAYYVLPDREDVGTRAKAEFILSCTSIAPAPTVNGRTTRKADAGMVAE